MKLKLYSSYVLFTFICYSYCYQSEADLVKGVLLRALNNRQKNNHQKSDNKVIVIPVSENQRHAVSVRHDHERDDRDDDDDIKVTEPTNSDSSTLPPNFKEIRMNLNNKNQELMKNMQQMMKNMMKQKNVRKQEQKQDGLQNNGHQNGQANGQNKHSNGNQKENQKQFQKAYEIQFRSETERTNKDGKQQGRGQQLMIMMPVVSMKTSNMDSLPESSMAETDVSNMDQQDFDDFEDMPSNLSQYESTGHFNDF